MLMKTRRAAGFFGALLAAVLGAQRSAGEPAPVAPGTAGPICDDWGYNARPPGEAPTACVDPGQTLRAVFADLAPRTNIQPTPRLIYRDDLRALRLKCDHGVPTLANERFRPTEALSMTCGPPDRRVGAVGIGRDAFHIAGECVLDGQWVPKEHVLAFILAHELMHLAADHDAQVAGYWARECAPWILSEEGQRAKARIEAALPPGLARAERRNRIYDQLEGICRTPERKRGFRTFVRSLESEADAEAFNFLDGVPNLSYSRRAGECAMRKLQDFEWAQAVSEDEEGGDHPLTSHRAETLRAIAEAVEAAEPGPGP